MESGPGAKGSLHAGTELGWCGELHWLRGQDADEYQNTIICIYICLVVVCCDRAHQLCAFIL